MCGLAADPGTTARYRLVSSSFHPSIVRLTIPTFSFYSPPGVAGKENLEI
jgi:hypothetical protein